MPRQINVSKLTPSSLPAEVQDVVLKGSIWAFSTSEIRIGDPDGFSIALPKLVYEVLSKYTPQTILGGGKYYYFFQDASLHATLSLTASEIPVVSNLRELITSKRPNEVEYRFHWYPNPGSSNFTDVSCLVGKDKSQEPHDVQVQGLFELTKEIAYLRSSNYSGDSVRIPVQGKNLFETLLYRIQPQYGDHNGYLAPAKMTALFTPAVGSLGTLSNIRNLCFEADGCDYRISNHLLGTG